MPKKKCSIANIDPPFHIIGPFSHLGYGSPILVYMYLCPFCEGPRGHRLPFTRPVNITHQKFRAYLPAWVPFPAIRTAKFKRSSPYYQPLIYILDSNSRYKHALTTFLSTFPFCLTTHFRCIDLSNTKTCTQVLFNESPPFYTMVFATIPAIPRSVQWADWQVWYDIHIKDAVAILSYYHAHWRPPNLNHLWKPILLAILSLSRMFHTPRKFSGSTVLSMTAYFSGAGNCGNHGNHHRERAGNFHYVIVSRNAQVHF